MARIRGEDTTDSENGACMGMICAKCGTVETSKGGATTDAAILE